MMLTCLGSGSSGNCYLLHNDVECLVIEAGLPLMEVKKAIGFNIKKIVGVVAGHCHQDHSKYVSEYEKIGIPVFKPYDGMTNMDLKGGVGFKIQAFDLVHDVPCYGFYITHPDMGSLVYASDTEYIKWKFSSVNHILVEANHDADIVDRNDPNFSHVVTGHMSIQTASRFISTNDNTALRNVVLIHLSSKNADESVFKEKIQKITSANVYIAKPKLNIDLSLPF